MSFSFFHLFRFLLITPGSSNEFPWISVWSLVKPHADYCVNMLDARWLRPAFAESCRLLRVNQAKELVTVRVWNAPDQSLTLHCRLELCVLHIRALCTSPVSMGGGVGDLSPSKQSTKLPQIEIWNTINKWRFHQFFNIKPPRTNIKHPIQT